MKSYKADANIRTPRTYDAPAIPDFDELQVQQLEEGCFLVIDTEDRFVFTCCAENDREAIEAYITHRIPEKLHVWAELPDGDTEPTDEMLPAIKFYTITATAYSSWEFERG
jgi:hypothetical protein